MTAILHTSIADAPIVFSQEGIIGKRIATHPKAEIVHLLIEPGYALPLHIMPMPVIFFVIEGTGILCTEVGDETCSAGTVVECPVGIKRGWANKSDKMLRVLVIKLAA